MLNRAWYWVFAACLAGAVASPIQAQGTTGKESGHFIAALDFFNNHDGVKHRIGNPAPPSNGLQNSAEQEYTRDGVRVRGLVASAALVIDWWLLLGEPTENYTFVWKSSGQYTISYTDKKGKAVSTTVTRGKLTPYPDLLKRFEALKPSDMDFVIKWRIGSQTDEDRDKFRNRHGISGSIGGGMPHVKEGFTTKVSSAGLLFEPSGKKPLSVPGIRPGKGQAFLGLSPKYDVGKLRIIFDYFNISTGQVIQDFRVTRITWPTGEMKAIAEKLDDYVNGREEPRPLEKIQAAEAADRNLKPYAGGGEMAEAFRDEAKSIEVFHDRNSGTIGIRKGTRVFITYPALSHDLWKIDNSRFFKHKFADDVLLGDYTNCGYKINLIDASGRIQSIDGQQEFSSRSNTDDAFGLRGGGFYLAADVEAHVGRVVTRLDWDNDHYIGLNRYTRYFDNYAQALNLINDVPDRGSSSKKRVVYMIIKINHMEVDPKSLSVINERTRYHVEVYEERDFRPCSR